MVLAAVRQSRRSGFALWAACLIALLGLILPNAALAACGTAPTVSLDEAAKYAGSGKSVDYVVTILNNDGGSCDFDLSTSGDAAGFSSLVVEGTPLTIGGGATGNATLRVSVDGGTADWTVNATTLSVDAVNEVATTTVFFNNPLLHNSVNLGSTKHGGNWGTTKAGSKYGSIVCSTCHVSGTTNIKRVRTIITTPDTGTGTFPGDGQPVTFLDARDTTSDLGDDSRADKTSSSNICEICHSYDAAKAVGTNKHAFDMSGPGDVGHYNKKDCTSCHAHSEGFKAGACSGCHGGGISGTVGKNFWPDASNTNLENDTPGRHLVHMDALSLRYYGVNATDLLNEVAADSKQVDLCGYCHDNPGDDADHSLVFPAETAFHPMWDKAAAASGSYTTLDGNCTNICHNSKATGTGAGTWGWGFGGDATSDCIMCHNDMTTDATTTGETHNDHLSAAAKFGRSIGCADCHDGATSWATSTKPASNHLDGVLDAGGTYTGLVPPGTSYGTCGNNACHNDGTAAVGNPVNNSYTWNNDGLDDCGICHAGAPASNDHTSHVNTAEDIYGSNANPSWTALDTNVAATNVYDFGCGQCHGDTLGNHLNGARNVSAADTGWNGSTCNTAYCHSHKDTDGVTTVQVTTPAWGTGFPAGDRCAQCHKNSPESAGHEEHQMGFHSEHVYSGKRDFLPVRNSDPLPANLVLGPADNGDGDAMDDSFDPLRGHGGKLSDGTITSTIFTCYVCHNSTVNTKPNDQATLCKTCHDDTIAPLMGDMTVADTNFHVNGQVDVVFVGEKIRSKAQIRDDLMVVPELSENWTRVGGYKVNDGSSYDEQPDTLANMAVAHGGWDAPSKTCTISCHLWEAGRVDKYPVHWMDNSIHGPQPIMCIDCHTRLPK